MAGKAGVPHFRCWGPIPQGQSLDQAKTNEPLVFAFKRTDVRGGGWADTLDFVRVCLRHHQEGRPHGLVTRSEVIAGVSRVCVAAWNNGREYALTPGEWHVERA